jgi:hypothetical protein
MTSNLWRMTMAPRLTKPSNPNNQNNDDEPMPVVSQRKRHDEGRFRLQVDRQTKASHATFEAAEAAGLAIKKGHPILQVAVYDSVDSVNKLIELPATK